MLQITCHVSTMYLHLIWTTSTCKFWCTNIHAVVTYHRTPLINAQCRSMPIKIVALIPMSINSDQCRSFPINDWHWEALRINAMILIGIYWQWALIEGVLILIYMSDMQSITQVNTNKSYNPYVCVWSTYILLHMEDTLCTLCQLIVTVCCPIEKWKYSYLKSIVWL